MSRFSIAVLILLVAWGVLAFGAVYPWAYWPLVAGTILLAGIVLGQPGPTPRLADALPFAVACVVFLLAAALQLVVLPLEQLAAISPSTVALLREYDIPFASGAITGHPLSVAPSQTITAIVLFAGWMLAIFASARLFSKTGAGTFVRLVRGLGFGVALLGILQAPFYAGKIYGFWTPQFEGSPYGPFVNKNHFAGWMLMAIPLVIGDLVARVARRLRETPASHQQWVGWLSSSDASSLSLHAGAALLMTVALVLTMSRSGILALLIAASVAVVTVARRLSSTTRAASVALVVMMLAAVLALVGPARLETRFSDDQGGFANRVGAWKDAISIVAAFPVAGTGLNTYHIAAIFYQKHDLRVRYAQAHNDYLQLAAEGGALLCVPAFLMIVQFVRLVRRRFAEPQSARAYWLRVGATVGIFTVGLQEVVDFSLQMPGNALLFAVLCGIALHRHRVTDYRMESVDHAR